MTNFTSPGVYVVEKDISEYPPQVNSSIVGIVGFASKGPIAGRTKFEAPTLITSPQQLIDTFGEPNENTISQSIDASLNILESTDQIYFVRCADGNASGVSARIPLGVPPRILLATNFGVPSAAFPPIMTLGTVGLTSSIRYTIGASAYDVGTSTGTALFPQQQFTVSSFNMGGGLYSATYLALEAAFKSNPILVENFDLEPYGNGTAWPEANINSPTSLLLLKNVGKEYIVSIFAEVVNTSLQTFALTGVFSPMRTFAPYDSGNPGAGLLSGVNSSSPLIASGADILTSSLSLRVESLFAGTGYAYSADQSGNIKGITIEAVALPNSKTRFNILNDGGLSESFELSMDTAGYPLSTLGSSIDTTKSEFIFGRFTSGNGVLLNAELSAVPLSANPLVNGQTKGYVNPMTFPAVSATFLSAAALSTTAGTIQPRGIKFKQGIYNTSGGNDGFPTTEEGVNTTVIGTTNSLGYKTGIESLDSEQVPISIALVPGLSEYDSVQNALIAKAESTSKFIALLSPPEAVGGVQQAINWHNGQAPDRQSAINSSYAAIYWPWVKVFNAFSGKDKFLAPEIFAAKQYCETDRATDPWFAPAGFVRGRLIRPTDTEIPLNEGDRGALYSNGNSINPIVNFAGRGIVIFGQKTALRTPTALDRVNIRRLMIYIRNVVLASSQRFIFEPNDQQTWSRIEELLNPLLDDIKSRRGITDFRVVCNSSVNTPIRIDRNELWCKVLIKPTKTAEFIVFELNLTNQSAKLGNL